MTVFHEVDCRCDWDGEFHNRRWIPDSQGLVQRTMCDYTYINHATAGTYRIRGYCQNCRSGVCATFTKGHGVESKYPPCPMCGCMVNLRWGVLA